MGDGMGVTAEYAWTAVALSLLALALSVVHGWRVVRAYQALRDDRAAVSLVKGVALVVISLGLTISASGLVLSVSALAVAGMSVARGSLLVLMATLVLADVYAVK